MRINLTQILAILLVVSVGLLTVQHKQKENLKEDNKILSNNVKAYANGLTRWKDAYGKTHTKLTEMQLTLADIAVAKDSITKAAIKVINDNKIKTKTIDKLGIIVSKLEAKLQVKPSDPVVIQEDTTIKCVTLTDSSFLVNEICYNDSGPVTSLVYGINTQSLIFTHDKVTMSPRRKFFLRRWLQKKQIICNIEIINDNPYIITQDSKFIQIIK